jgi:outer membrane protein OmpA-like peptidoglycan-associated protein
MKKVFSLIVVLLLTFTGFGQQEYSRWAVGAEFGVHSVSDESAIVTDPYNHFGLDVRYNVNEIVGVGLDFGHDNLSLKSIDGENSNVDFSRLNAKATISVFELLRLRHDNVNVLFSGGPGMSRLNHTDSDFKDDVFNISGGVDVVVRLGNSFAAKAGYTSTAQIAQNQTIDNIYKLSNAGISSVVDNLSVGLTFYPKSKKQREGKVPHADFYTPAPVIPVVNHITQVTEVKEITVVKEVPVKAECNCRVQEFVFFNHDKYDIKDEALNAITKVYTFLSENDDAVVKIYGFASDTQSSAEYNKELSAKRGSEISARLIEMGISQSRIEVYPEGKDYDLSKEFVHELARRVELIVE